MYRMEYTTLGGVISTIDRVNHGVTVVMSKIKDYVTK